MMKKKSVCLIGGTGFVGRHLVTRLAGNGIGCRVISRHPHRHKELEVNPGTRLIMADLNDQQALGDEFRKCDAVINLLGILNQGKGTDSFRHIHVELVDNILSACRTAGVKRLLHMSALNADESKGTSQYLRSKGEGENHAHTRGQPDIQVTSFKPSVIYGLDDSFINRFANLLRLPGPMPLACPDARFAPVYVGDVTEAFHQALSDPGTSGKHYELCGPEIYTLKELVELIAGYLGKTAPIIGLPDRAARIQASILEWVPGKPFTRDNYLSLQTPSICQEDGLGQLGINPTHLAAVLPAILGQSTSRGRIASLRRPG